METKFNIGDHITAIEFSKGIESAVVTGIDDKYYYLKILRGTGIIPISAQVNYQLEKR